MESRQPERRNETCAHTLVSCHPRPPAWGSRESAATPPCCQDGVWVLPGSSEQYSWANICHWHIFSIIIPSQVSSASVPGWPERLAQATELRRRNMKWWQPWWWWWWGIWGQPQLWAGWEEDDGQLLSPKTSELPKAAHLRCWHMPSLGGSHLGLGQVTGFPPQPSGDLSLQPGAITMVLTWGCCLHFPNPSACLRVGRGGTPALCSRNSKFSGRGIARDAPALHWLPMG